MHDNKYDRINTIAIDAELATHKTTLSYELDGAKA